MAPRIPYDPALRPRPDFTSATYEVVREALKAAPGNGVDTDEQAVNKLNEVHDLERAAESDKWRRQIAEDEDFNLDATAGDMHTRFTAHVQKKSIARQFVDFYHFLPEVALTEENERNVATHINRIETGRSSLRIIEDTQLSWAQVMSDKDRFMDSLALGDWGPQWLKMWAEFYVSMETHPDLVMEHGQSTMALYHAYMRGEAYSRLKAGQPVNIATISTKTLDRAWKEVNAKVLNAMIVEVKTSIAEMQRQVMQMVGVPSGQGRVQVRNKSRNFPTPYPSANTWRYSQLEDEGRVSRSFRTMPPSTHSRCHLCLGRFPHNVRKCNSARLWDNRRETFCRRNGRLFLEIAKGEEQGRELCANFQRPNGCTDSSHPDKHRCSGCGDKHHGAEGCPLGE